MAQCVVVAVLVVSVVVVVVVVIVVIVIVVVVVVVAVVAVIVIGVYVVDLLDGVDHPVGPQGPHHAELLQSRFVLPLLREDLLLGLDRLNEFPPALRRSFDVFVEAFELVQLRQYLDAAPAH
jgi:hypothetical protein